MKLLFATGILFLGLILIGCSWQQYFVIMNLSQRPLQIEYQVRITTEGFPIFDTEPAFYKASNRQDIHWEKPLTVAVESINDSTIRFVIPPASAAVIGQLSNDHYTGYNQYFINGRKFNLEYVQVISEQDTTRILPEQFDRYFTIDHGMVRLLFTNK